VRQRDQHRASTLSTRGDLGAVDRSLEPDFVNHDLPFPGAPAGPEGMRQAADAFRRACPDGQSDVQLLVAEGDMVVERFIASGTHRGDLMGVAPTGRTLILEGIQIFVSTGTRSSSAGAGSTRWGSPVNSSSPLGDPHTAGVRAPRPSRGRGGVGRSPP
jgi:ketosteroid isomerase-like protein